MLLARWLSIERRVVSPRRAFPFRAPIALGGRVRSAGRVRLTRGSSPSCITRCVFSSHKVDWYGTDRYNFYSYTGVTAEVPGAPLAAQLRPRHNNIGP